MRVSSPIGDLPFEPTRIAARRDGIEIEGRMGAWPARVHVDYADLPRAARLVAGPALAAAAVGVLAAVAAGRARRRRGAG